MFVGAVSVRAFPYSRIDVPNVKNMNVRSSALVQSAIVLQVLDIQDLKGFGWQIDAGEKIIVHAEEIGLFQQSSLQSINASTSESMRTEARCCYSKKAFILGCENKLRVTVKKRLRSVEIALSYLSIPCQ